MAAPDARAAAQYYPAGHWFSLLKVPAKSEFPGTGANGIAPGMRTPGRLPQKPEVGRVLGVSCAGDEGDARDPGRVDATCRRRKRGSGAFSSGQAGAQMMTGMTQLGMGRATAMFADWTDRIAAGEVPPAPARPQGIERTVVITEWDWADPKAYLHDEVSTDRRNPTLNANGPIYGALELSADYLPVLDPIEHAVRRIPLTVRDPATPPTSAAIGGALAVLGLGGDLDEQEQRPQPDVRREGPHLDHVNRAAPRRIRTSAKPARIIRRRS